MEPPLIRPRCIKKRDPSSISIDPELFIDPSPSQMDRKHGVLAAAIHGQPRQQLDPSVDASAAYPPPTSYVDSWPFLDPALHGQHLFRSAYREEEKSSILLHPPINHYDESDSWGLFKTQMQQCCVQLKFIFFSKYIGSCLDAELGYYVQ